MNRTLEQQRDPREARDDQDRSAAVADARRASQVASEIARNCAEWAQTSRFGEDDAADAVRAAWRAGHAADRAERCCSAADAASEARLGWAAVMSAVEADGRLITSIAEGIASL